MKLGQPVPDSNFASSRNRVALRGASVQAFWVRTRRLTAERRLGAAVAQHAELFGRKELAPRFVALHDLSLGVVVSSQSPEEASNRIAP